MHPRFRARLFARFAAVMLAVGCAAPPASTAPTPLPPPAPRPIPDLDAGAVPDSIAPDSFLVAVETTRGPIVMAIFRAWAPRGVDRFYNLVHQRFYDSAGVFRVVPKFVVQFGLAADPRLTALYRPRTIADDSVMHSNLRGTVTFARGGPNSRTTQLFINLVDNARLDTSNGFGFPPIGRVVQGMELVDLFNAQYSANGPSQDQIVSQGNQYLQRDFPGLDYILRMRVAKEWRQH
jgi:peptidyl-prolyl cis-trans isomerase A (cyclophilin A)